MTEPQAFTAEKITVEPAEFTLIKFDATEIARIAVEMAELLGVPNPLRVVVDETTPLAKLSAEVDGTTSDALVTIRAESGALENTQRFTHFSPDNARFAIGRMLLRARDRMRSDFADTPPDLELTNEQNAAWDAYCAGRLERAGVAVNQQRWRYNYRNRFGFSDDIDRAFDALWSADDLSWADLT